MKPFNVKDMLPRKGSFWNRLRLKYKLSLFNENSLDEVFTFRLSGLGAIIAAVGFIFVVFATVSFLVMGTPIKNLLPGYLKADTRIKMEQNVLRMDSLMCQMAVQTAYIERLKHLLNGEVYLDTVSFNEHLKRYPLDSLKEKSKYSTEFIQRYEEEEKNSLVVFSNLTPTDGLIFYPPINGEIARNFQPNNQQYGISIITLNKTPISSTLDGTVISTAYTATQGYVIQVQHIKDLISIYKQCGQLMKQVGDRVLGGEVIAFSSNTLQQNKTPLFEFQLWHKGAPLDPQSVISFKR